MSKETDYKKEYDRLSKLFASLPDNKRELVEGLIQQAARNRAILNECWDDIAKNGRTEKRVKNVQGDVVEVERDVSKLFTVTDRSYQTQIKLLNDFLPTDSRGSGTLAEFMEEFKDA